VSTIKNNIDFVCSFKKIKSEEKDMLKEYAVALVLSTATPVAADKQEGAKQAPESQKEVATETNYIPKPRTGGNGMGIGL
jgi:hypothetical protein